MGRRDKGTFARRGISLPGFKVTALTILLAFAVGALMAWLTSLLAEAVWSAGEPGPSPSPSASPSPAPEVTVPPLHIITRNFNDDDRLAGLTSLDFPYEGEGVFAVVSGHTNPLRDGPPIRHVRVEVEKGINIDGRAFATFVMTALNDQRGWGSSNRLQYVRTDGVADYQVVIASPYTAAAMCPDPHATAPEAAPLEPVVTPAPQSSPPPSPVPGEGDTSCAERGIMVLSVYDWAAGLEAYAPEHQQARVYLLMHGMGHLRGLPHEECTSGRATVMVDQRELPERCTVNPWPFPDADTGSDDDGDDE